jgi:hypothetical protein
MAYYKNPTDMHEKRAESNKKKADAEYTQYKDAQERGDSQEAQDHYRKSQYHYNQEKEEKEKAKQDEGKTWRLNTLR